MSKNGVSVNDSENVVIAQGGRIDRIVQVIRRIYPGFGRKQFWVLAVIGVLGIAAVVVAAVKGSQEHGLIRSEFGAFQKDLDKVAETMPALANMRTDLENKFKEGLSALEKKEYSVAIKIFKEVEEKVPVGSVLNMIGIAYRDTGEYGQAREYFTKAALPGTESKEAAENAKKLREQGLGAQPIGGIKVVTYTSRSIGYRGPHTLFDGDPDEWWESADGFFPQSFVFELPGPFLVTGFSFDNATPGAQDRASREVEISVSVTAAHLGFGPVASYTLKQRDINQGFQLSKPVRARWVRLDIRSNYGNKGQTALNELRILGVPESQ
jgi:hypothetical protein